MEPSSLTMEPLMHNFEPTSSYMGEQLMISNRRLPFNTPPHPSPNFFLCENLAYRYWQLSVCNPILSISKSLTSRYKILLSQFEHFVLDIKFWILTSLYQFLSLILSPIILYSPLLSIQSQSIDSFQPIL